MCRLKKEYKQPVIGIGDFNTAREEIDVYDPIKKNQTAGFTREEREGISKMLSQGFVDAFRSLYPSEKKYTQVLFIFRISQFVFRYWQSPIYKKHKKGWRLGYLKQCGLDD